VKLIFIHQRDQNRSCREVIKGEIVEMLTVLSKGVMSSLMHQLNLKIDLDLVCRRYSRGWRRVTQLPVDLLRRPVKILAILIDDRETVENIVMASFQTLVFAVSTSVERDMIVQLIFQIDVKIDEDQLRCSEEKGKFEICFQTSG